MRIQCREDCIFAVELSWGLADGLDCEDEICVIVACLCVRLGHTGIFVSPNHNLRDLVRTSSQTSPPVMSSLLFGPRRRRWAEMAGRLSSRQVLYAVERSGGQGRTGATRRRAQGSFARARRAWRGSDLDRSEHHGTLFMGKPNPSGKV